MLSISILLFLDHLSRKEVLEDSKLLFLSAGSLLLGVAFSTIRWNLYHKLWRLIPFCSAIAVVIAASYLADSGLTEYSGIGLTIVVVLALAYVGFTQNPGSSLIASAVLAGIVFYYIQNYDVDFSVYALFVVIPAGAIVGEIISIIKHYLNRQVLLKDRRNTSIGHLNNVLKTFHRPISLEQASLEIATTTQQLFDAERTTVVLRNPQGELVSSNAGKSEKLESVNELTEQTAKLVVEAIGGSEPRLVELEDSLLLVCPLPAADIPAGAVVAYPIKTNDPEFLLSTAKLFSTQIGIAIEHLFVIDQLRKDNTTDELTGIGNRKHANALLDSLEEGDALILLDLDGFKEVNDTYGHPAGDQVLLDLSAHLKSCLRDSDTSARLGGDEFLVVARKAFADPEAVAHRILNGWDIPGRSTTISAGVALHERKASTQETYDRADKALYQAKSNGKNQAKLWQQPDLELST